MASTTRSHYKFARAYQLVYLWGCSCVIFQAWLTSENPNPVSKGFWSSLGIFFATVLGLPKASSEVDTAPLASFSVVLVKWSRRDRVYRSVVTYMGGTKTTKLSEPKCNSAITHSQLLRTRQENTHHFITSNISYQVLLVFNCQWKFADTRQYPRPLPASTTCSQRLNTTTTSQYTTRVKRNSISKRVLTVECV